LAALFCLVFAAREARSEGALQARGARVGSCGLLPLVRTEVQAEASAQVTSVSVTQRFHNGCAERVEAVYIFPLPEDAAVDAMEMRIGTRVVRASIDRRDQARQRYERARDHGQRAALLEQERPNIFTFSVANIDPGADIDVNLHYFAMAKYDHGTYELVFPMVVGPRYIPGAALAPPQSGTGAHPDTDRVTDASRISPAYVAPGTRSGHAISLRVRVASGSELDTLESPAHDVIVQRTSPTSAEVSLRDKDEIPNRDFILRWRNRAPELQASVLAHRPVTQGDGYVALTLEPRHDAPPAEIAAREIFFLLDTSGSMQGPPLDAVKSSVRRALGTMSPADSFQIIDFADTASSLAPRPLAATAAHVAQGLRYLDNLQASGGTNQLAGIHAALTAPGDAMRLRYVVFMTDGYIGNESEVIALTRREIGQARIFSFGIGAATNRYLLEEVALAGRGYAEFLRQDENAEAMVARFYDRIARPYLTDVTVDWGGLAVAETYPTPLPDLSALQPLVVFGRYRAAASGRVTVRGRVAGRPFERVLNVNLPAVESANAAVASVWARQKIASLSREEHTHPDNRELAEAITSVALRHHLVSRYTSFVAVEERPSGPAGRPLQVSQPNEAPQGVNLQAAGGRVVNANGNMTGDSVGDAFGYGGLGVSGTGWGGGGTGEGTVGFGAIGSVGHGSGSGAGQGYGAGAGRGLRGRSVRTPYVRASPPAVLGALSPEVIRRVVLRNLGQVNHCYEVALAARPGIRGRLSLSFVIALNGTVAAVSLAGGNVTDAALVQCVSAAVRRWVFPAPTGGTVTVTYPFNFEPGDTASLRRRYADPPGAFTRGSSSVSSSSTFCISSARRSSSGTLA
jgi:Ca-activated chloride channel family protein